MNVTELCVNCKQNNSCTMCWKTSKKKCPHFIQKNNADRIRAMSDEELARKLVNTAYRYDWKQDEDYWYFPNGTTKTNYKPKAIEAWLEWLKQPAE